MTNRRVKRLGILGGTFNPIHAGHLIVAECAREQLGLDQVWFIPTATPPHKRPRHLLDGQTRLAMVRLAVQGHSAFRASDLELRLGGVSYTIRTMRILRDRSPAAKWFLLVGADMLKVRWLGWEELRRLCTVVVAGRPAAAARRLPRGMQRLSTPLVDISSSMIRDRIRNGQSVRYLVPEPVARYITRHRLYRETP